MLEETGFINDMEATCMLLANILHETGNMRWLKELASGEAYEGRSDLGNVSPGDGPRYKGAGVLQLTGKYNYSRLSKALKDPKVMEGCDYVASTYPFRSAVPWIRENSLLTIARTQGFEAVCVRINGGHNGWSDRLAKYQTCKSVIM
jgi:putative chitinase